ncbi:MAG TPA: hypothetical protein VKP30_19505 [Polyangiaceae bacterium]|nr:hypothetical protein [Polyangiaceae bacterium]
MKQKFWMSLTAIAIGVGAAGTVLCLPGGSVQAKPAAKKAKAAGNQLKRDFVLAPQGLRWGISFALLAKVYDDAFDAEYVPIYKRTEPGQQMQLLDSELSEKKGIIRRSKVDFGTSPTGVDSGPLAGEYAYNNSESMAKVQLNGGTQRYFFFHGDRLWKVYDEYKIGAGSKLGASWEDAVKTLSELLGGPPEMMPPDGAIGRNFDEAVWLTPTMAIRAIDRSHQKVVAVAWADKSMHEKFGIRKPNAKLPNPQAMDSAVRDVMAPDPNVQKLRTGPAPEEGKKKGASK